jgi:transposase
MPTPLRPSATSSSAYVTSPGGFANAVVYVLVTGIAWRHLPPELGCSPATAHRRLTEWERAGIWQRLHRELVRRLNAAGKLDWSAGVIDGSQVRALEGGA